MINTEKPFWGVLIKFVLYCNVEVESNVLKNLLVSVISHVRLLAYNFQGIRGLVSRLNCGAKSVGIRNEC